VVKKRRIFAFTSAGRSERITMPDSGIGGDCQISSIWSATWGFWRRRKTVLTELEVATCTWLLATERALAWWLAALTVEKQALGSMFRGPKK